MTPAKPWHKVVGAMIGHEAIPQSITPAGVLLVQASTAAWAAELGNMTDRIMDRIVDEAWCFQSIPVRAIEWTEYPARPSLRLVK